MGKKGGGRVRVKQVGPKAPVNPLESLAIPPEEMINFPVKPDTNISHVWPLSESFTMEYKHFSVIYPTYLDSDKTVKQGRRIAAKDAVPNPTVVDIGQALQIMNIRHVVQPYKGYSRDVESQWDNLGRVLVDLDQAVPEVYDVDNLPDCDAKLNKKRLLREIAKLIPGLPARIQRIEQYQKELEEQKAKEAAAHKAVSQKATTGGGSSKKKKGKKRR